jgi:beta-1,4-mannosyl-glycoprotein beta-1,4-N-acetylglucosaminyltransferase
MIVDTFMINDEFDMLECRLTEMASAVDWFIAIEADVDHQNHPKPYHLTNNLDRFAPWKDKLVVVQATGLPTTPHDLDPWAREWAQRDWVWQGLEQIPDLDDTAIVLHGDVDEICDPLHVRNVRPRFKEFVQFAQRLHCFAVDWQHPDPWGGTVACTLETARALGERQYVGDDMYHPGAWQLVRNQRNGLQRRNFEWLGTGWRTTVLPDAGWHFSWLGGQEAALRKLGSFCHPEVADRVSAGLATDMFLRDGWHVDGRKMQAVDVDETWPRWIVDGHAPAEWFRPR